MLVKKTLLLPCNFYWDPQWWPLFLLMSDQCCSLGPGWVEHVMEQLNTLWSWPPLTVRSEHLSSASTPWKHLLHMRYPLQWTCSCQMWWKLIQTAGWCSRNLSTFSYALFNVVMIYAFCSVIRLSLLLFKRCAGKNTIIYPTWTASEQALILHVWVCLCGIGSKQNSLPWFALFETHTGVDLSIDSRKASQQWHF